MDTGRLNQWIGRFQPLHRWLVLVAVFFPGLYMATVVQRLAVDIGCWDVWENGPLLQKWHDGTLGWKGLWAAQIQHRIVIPRLLIVAMAHLSGGDFRWEQYAAFSMSGLGSILVYRLLRRTVGIGSPWVPGLGLVANLLIFSPMLYQNWFWGSSLWMAIPMPCLLAALCVGQARWPTPGKIGVIALLGLVSTFSFAHGLCFWPVAVVYVFLHPAPGLWKLRLLWAGALAAFATVVVAAYFHNLVNEAYHAYNLKPGDSAMIEAGARDWGRVLRVFCAFLGSLFARDPWESGNPLDRSIGIGRWIFVTWLLAAAAVVALRRRGGLWTAALPWLALSAYGLGVGAMIAVGRSDIGEFRALTPRYGAVSLFVWVATGVLVFLVARQVCSAAAGTGKRNLVRSAGISCLTAAAVWIWTSWPYGLHLSKIWHFARLQARAHVVFLGHFPPEAQRATFSQLDKSDPRAPTPQEQWAYVMDSIRTLRGLGLFRTPALTAPFVDAAPLKPQKKPLAPEKAGVSEAIREKDGGWRLRGRARFGQDRPADLVVVSAPGADGPQRIVGIGQMKAAPALRLPPLDFEFSNVDAEAVDAVFHRWEARLPPGATDGLPALQLWAFDVESMQLIPFASPVPLQ